LEKKINTVLFTYSFHHRKTLDFIQRLYEEGFSVSLILAADYELIKSPKSAFKFKPKKLTTSLEILVKKYSIPFHIVKHNSEESEVLLKKYKINFGIISGARILKNNIIQAIKYGVLNFHPGLLPYVRGLDSILWSIDKDYPIGVTAHLINEKIDAGCLVYQKKTSISKEDDIYSLYEKNYQLQLDLIPISLNLIFKKNTFPSLKMGEYNHKMSYAKQLDLQKKVKQYINKYHV
tara:strand:+ start:1529 stop:2230 length:702 start_codon:yes stop_codon:yes gene_type:complete